MSADPTVWREPFGVLTNGEGVDAVNLSRAADRLIVQVIDYGATVTQVLAMSRNGLTYVVRGLPDLAAYEADPAYHGPVVGRCANRIDGAAFMLDGERFPLTANEGPTCLHGGRLGLSKRLWRFERAAEGRADLTYDSPDGEEGFPGRLSCRIALEAVDDTAFRITWEAETDRPTPVNLTQHLYFNLSGDPATTILDHELTVAAEAITAVDARLIPTGERMPVAGTPFDFRSPRRIGEALAQPHPQLGPGGGIDHNWVLSGAAPAVRLRSPESGLVLEIETDQPGLQIYGGQGLKPPFIPHGAIVFEPQGFPDAINRPSFPSVVLRPGETYRRSALYRFTAGPPG